MRIDDHTDFNIKIFSEITQGTVFKTFKPGGLFMKTFSQKDKSGNVLCNAVDLESGCPIFFEESKPVAVLSAELVIR